MPPPRSLGPLLAVPTCALPLLATACLRRTVPPTTAGVSTVALSGGLGKSMAYVARTDSGVVLIDLGWWGGERAARRALARLAADSAGVRHVFLTHSHRDHVGAWRLVRGARFHLATPEAARLGGRERHRGVVPYLVEYVKPSDLPRAGEVAMDGFPRDTAFVLGSDTLRAYVVPGHTAGSAAYLFRGILFLGDAATYTPWGGFAPARRIYSDDVPASRASLDALWPRLPPNAVRWVCTAHAYCTRFNAAFVRDVRR